MNYKGSRPSKCKKIFQMHLRVYARVLHVCDISVQTQNPVQKIPNHPVACKLSILVLPFSNNAGYMSLERREKDVQAGEEEIEQFKVK